MAGLDPTMTAAPPASPRAMQPAGIAPPDLMPQGMEEGEPASPEEQELYEKVVSGALLVIFDREKGMFKMLVEQFKTSADVAGDIAEVAAQVATRIDGSARDDGTPIPAEIMFHAGKEIVEILGDLAEASGAVVDEATLEQAFFGALDRYRSMAQQDGRLDEQGVQDDAGIIRQMDEQGLFGTGDAQPVAPQPEAMPPVAPQMAPAGMAV